MNIKIFKKATAALLVLSTILGCSVFNVFADTSSTVTATLNEAKISFNGGSAKTIKCYNVGGYNYYRVRDVLKALNMDVVVANPATSPSGSILIKAETPYKEGSALPDLTTQSPTVELRSVDVIWTSMPYNDASNFNLNNSNFYKLADLAAAANNYLEVKKSGQKNSGVAPKGDARYITTISVSYDNATKVTSINTVKNDLLPAWNAAHGATSVTDMPMAAPAPEGTVVPAPSSSTAPAPASQAMPSAPPVVGSIPAKILVDQNVSAYKNGNPNDGVNFDNIMPAYKPVDYPLGQCTWYALSRYYEVTGVNLPSIMGGAGYTTAIQNAAAGKYAGFTSSANPKDVSAYAVAIYNHHYIFVEYVAKDSNGNPTTIYYSDANASGTDGVFVPGRDGMVKSETYQDFSSGLLGLIFAK